MHEIIEVAIEALRRDVGAVQQNCGQCVTRLAMLDEYKEIVRKHNGFESLHQISLKEKQKTDMSLPAAFRR